MKKLPTCKLYSGCKHVATMYVDRLWLRVEDGRRTVACEEHAATIGSKHTADLPWNPTEFFKVTPMVLS